MSLAIDDDPLGYGCVESSLDCLGGLEISSPHGAVETAHVRARQNKASGTRTILYAAGRAKRAQKMRRRQRERRRQRHDFARSAQIPCLLKREDVERKTPTLNDLSKESFDFQAEDFSSLPWLGSGSDYDLLLSTPRRADDNEWSVGQMGTHENTEVKKQSGQTTPKTCTTPDVRISPSPGSPPVAVTIGPDLSPEELKAAIVKAAGRQSFVQAPFVLRHPEGYVVPLEHFSMVAAAAESDEPLLLVESAAGTRAPPHCSSEQPHAPQVLPPPVDHGAEHLEPKVLEWVHRPPYGAAVWLHAKRTKSGAIARSTAAHVFKPAPTVKFSATKFSGKDNLRLLENAVVRLFNSGLNEVSHLLHCGKAIVTQEPQVQDNDNDFAGSSSQTYTISWPEMAVLDVCRPVDGVADSLSAKELQSRRGATGFFHMSVEVHGFPTLWLTTADGSPAPIVIKNERLSMLGEQSWKRICCGPYADHAACLAAGSHVGPGGRRLCNECRPCLKPVMANAQPAQVKKEK